MKIGNFFEGKYHYPKSSGIDSCDILIKKDCPANLDHRLWECPVEYAHANKAISSALDGFKVWKKSSLEQRIELLTKYKTLLTERVEEIGRAIALDTGKPLWEAIGEAKLLAAKVDVTIKESLPRIAEKNYENIAPGTSGAVVYKPIGPILIIGPFNFPCHLANGQIVNALISGNSIIFKPSEKTAYSSQLMFNTLVDAGLPKTVINLIHGDGEMASRIVNAKEVKGIFFTGSAEVGKLILKSTCDDLSKLVALELGGKNCSFIHHDANLDFTLPELIKAAFLTSGQRCTSTAIAFVHEKIADEFVAKTHQIAKKIIVDHPIDAEKQPFMGPLIEKKAVDNYLLYMGMAKREGLEEVMRGKQIEKQYRGHYVSPSIHFTKSIDTTSHFFRDEIFAPNLLFVSYSNIEEAVKIANSLDYGLASALFSTDKKLYHKVLEDLDVGLLNLNRSTVGASGRLPFGGVKSSGNYRPAAVSMIDSCVYPVASLDYESQTVEELVGINN